MSLIQLAGIERVFHLGDSTVHALSLSLIHIWTTMQRRAFVKSGALALVTMGLSPSFLRRSAYGLDLPRAARGKVLILSLIHI